jgi:signal transduction histidine kinase/CheY-like chemotaxis protein
MVVLVPNAPTQARVREIASSRFETSQRGLLVQTMSGRVETCVREVRATVGPDPLAVLVLDEPSALDALAAGADEALSLPDHDAVDEATVVSLLDRARLRAELRGQQEQRFASLAQLEKLSALGTLVTGVAHEINNPLTGALLSLEMLKNELEPLYQGAAKLREHANEGRVPTLEEVRSLAVRMRSGSTQPTMAREIIGDVMRACESIADTVKDLCIYARARDNEPRELVDVRSVLDRILRLLGREAGPNVHIELDYGTDVPPVLAPRTRLTQVLTNLLANAFQAVRELPRDMHRIRIALRADDEIVSMIVEDSGPGIAPEVVERIFDPFFTTKRDPAGAGLGLSVSRSIMRSLGGDLMVESVHGDGAVFIAWLPRPAVRQLMALDGTGAPKRERRHAIMVVEPDPQVLGALARLLRERYDVLLATSGQEALELLSSGSKPDIIISEAEAYDSQRVPFPQWLASERPDLAPRLVLTTSRPEPATTLVGLPCLLKPLDPSTLFKAIEERLLSPLRSQARETEREALPERKVFRC